MTADEHRSLTPEEFVAGVRALVGRRVYVGLGQIDQSMVFGLPGQLRDVEPQLLEQMSAAPAFADAAGLVAFYVWGGQDMGFAPFFALDPARVEDAWLDDDGTLHCSSGDTGINVTPIEGN